MKDKCAIIHHSTQFSGLLGQNKSFEVLTPPQVVALEESVLNSYKGIITFCELENDVNNKVVSINKYYGIELIQILRRQKNLRAPVAFTSFSDRKELTLKKLSRSIVNAIGHTFVPFPCHPNDWIVALKNMEPLDDLELYDIQKNYCTNIGLAQLRLHDLSRFKSDDNLTLERINSELKTTLKLVFQLFDEQVELIQKEYDELFKPLNLENKLEAFSFVESKCSELIDLNSPSGSSISKLKARNYWKLLFLDDEITCEHRLIKELQTRDIEIICVRSAQEAWHEINKDAQQENKITIVVSDYRLEELREDVLVHQKVQGYKFLKQLSQDKPYLGLVALSALPRKFLFESFRHYGVKVDIFPKKDYLENEETLHILCDELIQIGDENSEAIARLPRISTDKWKLFELFYIHHRNSISYKANESYISMRSKAYCEGVKQGEFPFDLVGYTVELGGKKTPLNEKNFQEFLEKMICRRVVLWYSRYNRTESPKEIHKILLGNKYGAYLTKVQERIDRDILRGKKAQTFEVKLDNNAKNQVTTNLAMPVSEFPWNMTIEEKYWLIYQMGMSDISYLEEEEVRVLELFENKLFAWFSERNLFMEIFNESRPNNYGRIKSILNRIAINLHNNRDLVDPFNLLVTGLRATLTSFCLNGQPDNLKSRSNKLIYKFLSGLAARNKKIKALPVDVPLVGSFENIKKRVQSVVLKKIGRDKADVLESIAFLFFHSLEQDKIHYQSIDIYAKKLLEEYNEQECLVNFKNTDLDKISNLKDFSESFDYEL